MNNPLNNWPLQVKWGLGLFKKHMHYVLEENRDLEFIDLNTMINDVKQLN